MRARRPSAVAMRSAPRGPAKRLQRALHGATRRGAQSPCCSGYLLTMHQLPRAADSPAHDCVPRPADPLASFPHAQDRAQRGAGADRARSPLKAPTRRDIWPGRVPHRPAALGPHSQMGAIGAFRSAEGMEPPHTRRRAAPHDPQGLVHDAGKPARSWGAVVHRVERKSTSGKGPCCGDPRSRAKGI
jgi:hypothetical protein